MKKDFSKKYNRRATRATNTGQTLWRWVIAMAITGLLFCSGFVAFQYKKNPQNYPVLTTYVSNATTWLASHRNHIRQEIGKVKHLAAKNTTEEEEIHFEFYTALPNMQMNVPVPSQPSEPQSNPVATPAPTKIANNTANNDATINTDKIEQELSAQLNQGRYFLQLGVFRTQDSAMRFQKTLTDAGFQANLVKIVSTEKKVFKVQMGPFNNKSQARLAQIDLEKKGYNGVMHKLEVS